jgi:two-component system sensor histidine kinase VicK
MLHQVGLLFSVKESLSADQLESIIMIERHLGKMTRVVDALNDLQKASGLQNLEVTNIADLARSALDRFDEAAKNNAVILTTVFHQEPLMVLVDAEHISQVFDALISNAIRYSAGGQVTIQAGKGKNRMVHVMVQDTGPGISVEHQSQIFHPFYQVDTTAMYPHNGLGIGLTLAKDIIKSHGGEMWVKSDTGSGSTFNFTLPPTGNQETG